MKKRKKGGSVARNVIFIIMIVILSLILVIQGTYILSELSEPQNPYHAEESDYLRQITYEKYYRVFSEAADDCVIDRKFTATEDEIRAVGYYYEAATLCKAYEAVGDAASAAKQRERMEKFRRRAGSYAGETEKIDAVLEEMAKR